MATEARRFLDAPSVSSSSYAIFRPFLPETDETGAKTQNGGPLPGWESRALGAVLGLVCGDVLGSPLPCPPVEYGGQEGEGTGRSTTCQPPSI